MPRFVVSKSYSGYRVDRYLAEKLTQLSRSFINQLCDDDLVSVNKVIVKPSYNLKTNDKVEVDFDLKKLEKVPKIKLPIIYEDDDVLVIAKPAGVLTHSKGQYNPEATVATFIKDRLTGLEGNRAGIVHRLDRGTSGVMISAKNSPSLKWLQKQFSSRKVKKTYIAVVQGYLNPEAAIIDMPIERNPKRPQTFRAGPNGKSAITQYKTLKRGSTYSLIELTPHTGRTHQLRVHLQKLGHTIVGDNLYDGQLADRLFLHALRLEITLPNHRRAVFESKLPKEFNDMLKK